MQTLSDQPADAGGHFGVHSPDDEGELALLAQFTRCDSVAALACSIGKSLGVRSGDLIEAAGLGASLNDK
jgi:hypothetical protein